jgi:hypothetical protein
MGKINAVLSQLDIERVVWVDDIFDEQGLLSDEDLAQYLQNEADVVSVCKRAGFSPDFLTFAESLLGVDDSSGLYQQKLPGESQDAKRDLSAIARGVAKDENELTSIHVRALTTVFGEKLVRCSFADWPSRAEELMQDERAIFLVDLKNRRNADGLNGKLILQQLIANSFAGLVTLFTHECTREGELELLEQIRNDLRDQENNGRSASLRIGVVSKQRCQQEDVEKVQEDLAAPIHRLAMTTTFSLLASKVATSLIEGINEGVAILSKLPVIDIDRAVFQNSMREGCSEIELIERLLSLTQRDAVAKSLKTSNELNKLLAKARESWITSDANYRPRVLSESLVSLRMLEVFDSEELINQTHSPLANGDIFEHSDGERVRQYVLLMSPCDSLVRKDGTRQLDTGVFVSLAEMDKSNHVVAKPSRTFALQSTDGNAAEAQASGDVGLKAQEGDETRSEYNEDDSKLRFYNIPANLDKTYRLDFLVSSPVMLDTLEWCVFNEDGRVQYNKDITPKLELLNGWSKRLRKLKEARKVNGCSDPSNIPWPYKYVALKTNGFSSIHATSIEKDADGKPIKGHLFFDLRRVKRLRSPYADAALNAFLNYSGRPAFEHEFLR